MAVSSTFLQTLGPSLLYTHEYSNSSNITMSSVGLTVWARWPVGVPMLVAFQFDGANNNRGQMYVNGDTIFDSYSTGNGSFRNTAGWGVGYGVASTDPDYISEYRIYGAGDLGIKPGLKFSYIRLHGMK